MNQQATLRYLTELRKRIILSLLSFIILFIITLYFSNPLYTWLANPLLQHLPQKNLIATNLISAFFTPFELAFYVAVFVSVPVFLYHLWAFIAPALYPQEKRTIWPLLLGTIILFYFGLLFAYWIIFPILFAFLTHAAPQGVQVMPDISQYLEFALKLFLIFGVIFEIPVMVIVLVKTKVTTREKLIQWRPYIIVGAFVVGMLLAPPDVLSQALVALSLWCLYEIGMFFLRFMK